MLAIPARICIIKNKVYASSLKEVRKMALMNRCIFGINLHTEDTEEILTKYGHTVRVENLELHVGNFEYAKRGDTRRVFVFDRDDYRFQKLRQNIGVYQVPHVVGCLLGCLVGVEGDLIRFRVNETRPSHLLMCCMDSERVRELALKAEPDALSDYTGHGVFFVVYDLARRHSMDYSRGQECFDGYYDEDPDVEDYYNGSYDAMLDEDDSLIEMRLKYSGF
jgi:hypothetical protein